MLKKSFHRSRSGVISTWFFSIFLICISLVSAAAENQVRLLKSMINLRACQKYLSAECEVIRDLRRLIECGELGEETYQTVLYTYEVSIHEKDLYVTISDPYEVLIVQVSEHGTIMDYEAMRDPDEIME